jgi:hypothetical protein
MSNAITRIPSNDESIKYVLLLLISGIQGDEYFVYRD